MPHGFGAGCRAVAQVLSALFTPPRTLLALPMIPEARASPAPTKLFPTSWPV